jgi:hypothetical protein
MHHHAPPPPKTTQIQDAEGQTPLHRACRNDHPLAVLALLLLGADPGVETCDGERPAQTTASKLARGFLRVRACVRAFVVGRISLSFCVVCVCVCMCGACVCGPFRTMGLATSRGCLGTDGDRGLLAVHTITLACWLAGSYIQMAEGACWPSGAASSAARQRAAWRVAQRARKEEGAEASSLAMGALYGRGYQSGVGGPGNGEKQDKRERGASPSTRSTGSSSILSVGSVDDEEEDDDEEEEEQMLLVGHGGQGMDEEELEQEDEAALLLGRRGRRGTGHYRIVV